MLPPTEFTHMPLDRATAGHPHRGFPLQFSSGRPGAIAPIQRLAPDARKGHAPLSLVSFFGQVVSDHRHTGAVAPSSVWVAKELAKTLTAAPAGVAPRKVLEAGPGTGALTATLVDALRPGDHLTLCEINGVFVKHLERRFGSEGRLAAKRAQVTIHHGPVEDLGLHDHFDHIVCGLPFNNFEPELVERIFKGFEDALRAGGTVDFFEYVAIRRIKAPFVNKAERIRLRAVAKVLGDRLDRHQHRRKFIAINFPPAWTHHLKY